mmetsp:Transcript_45124/g.149595  ORF Transcript_45124/g.149595 Transcript_45124/m.149595 type:complete len:203 (-) Transcript_45124:50-658(-)
MRSLPSATRTRHRPRRTRCASRRRTSQILRPTPQMSESGESVRRTKRSPRAYSARAAARRFCSPRGLLPSLQRRPRRSSALCPRRRWGSSLRCWAAPTASGPPWRRRGAEAAASRGDDGGGGEGGGGEGSEGGGGEGAARRLAHRPSALLQPPWRTQHHSRSCRAAGRRGTTRVKMLEEDQRAVLRVHTLLTAHPPRPASGF